MTVKKSVAVALDVLGAIAVVWFAWQRVTGVPMDWIDWALIGYAVGVIVGVFAMTSKPAAL